MSLQPSTQHTPQAPQKAVGTATTAGVIARQDGDERIISPSPLDAIGSTSANETAGSTDGHLKAASPEAKPSDTLNEVHATLHDEDDTSSKTSDDDGSEPSDTGPGTFGSPLAEFAMPMPRKRQRIPRSKRAIACSPALLEQSCRLPRHGNRDDIAHGLIQSLGLMTTLELLPTRIATQSELEEYHTPEYVAALKRAESGKSSPADEDFGLVDDCPVFPGLYSYITYVTGATLAATDAILAGSPLAINLTGGRHHAQSEEAAGFCYVNDCVLAIMKLKQRFSRILYLDIDVHHGDGVEAAFAYTSSVLTLSFHKYGNFFPGTGALKPEKGMQGVVNVPLKSGLSDQSFLRVYTRVLKEVMACYRPEVVVLVAGVDGLATDPTAAWNLTSEGYASAMKMLAGCLKATASPRADGSTEGVPLLFLGGGGYDKVGTAKCWASMLAELLGVADALPECIPTADPNLQLFAPTYSLATESKLMPDENTPKYLAKVLATISRRLQRLKTAVDKAFGEG